MHILRKLDKHRSALRNMILSNSKKTIAHCSFHESNALRLLAAETPTLLARLLQTSPDQIQDAINYPQYTHYAIAKKKGGKRAICAPENELKQLQKRLNFFLQAYYLHIKPAEVHGFVINPNYLGKTCNIVSNAKAHTGKKYVFNLDLKDFFSRITTKQVKSVFMSDLFVFDENMANALTLLVTYQGKLPTGAPSSPVVSNFVCLPLDDALKGFSIDQGWSYSRYADDLTFSSNSPIQTDDILDLINIIKQYGFHVNNKKVRLSTSVRKQTVTGLVVNEKVNIDRKVLKKIRAMLHHLHTGGLAAATQKHFHLTRPASEREKAFFLNRLDGLINFVGQVRGKEDHMYRNFHNSMALYHANQELSHP